MMGESSENSRTMSSSSASGKSSSCSSSSSSSVGDILGSSGSSGGAAGRICVGSREKSRSWVERKARRFAVSSFVGGRLEGDAGIGGVGGRVVGNAWDVGLAGRVGGGESSRWIWVLLTKKSSKLSSGMDSALDGSGIRGGFWKPVDLVSVAWTGVRRGA